MKICLLKSHLWPTYEEHKRVYMPVGTVVEAEQDFEYCSGWYQTFHKGRLLRIDGRNVRRLSVLEQLAYCAN